MKALTVVLNKVVVRQFYLRNAGFFLVLFFLGFGIQQPPTLLISPLFLRGVVGSPAMLVVVLGLLLLYYAKCFHFFWKVLRLPENEYLHVAALLPATAIMGSLLYVHIILFLPAITYSGILGFQAAGVGSLVVLGAGVLFHLLLAFLTIWHFRARLRTTQPETETDRVARLWLFPGFSSPALLPVRYLLRHEGMALLLTKLFSLGILLGFMLLYPYPEYNLRPTLVGFLMGVSANALLVQVMHLFTEEDLPLLRQLPLPLTKRFNWVAGGMAVLVLPEGLVLFYLLPPWLPWLQAISLLLFGISLLMLFYSWLYYKKTDLRKYLRTVFGAFMVLLPLLLLEVPLLLLAMICLGLAYGLLHKYYYKYEEVDLEEDQKETS